MSVSVFPVPFTTLIGRDQDVARVAELLGRPEVRLVTITGPGGIGKTRLAAQASRELAGRYRDGVVFVSLDSVIDHSLVPAALATAAGVRESSEMSLLASIVRHLHDQQMLVVFDNFEQVVAAATFVAELLGACPSVDVLATSRVSLRIRGEQEYPLAPLPLPGPGWAPSGHGAIDVLERNSAVTLFIERARDVSPQFGLTDGNADAVVQICTRLDGLPLAIELAAARTKMLPPAAILSRLEHRFALLTGGARDLPDRQQTLWNAVAWSYDLLSEDERKLYRRLSVFRGGWTIEAAEGVAGNPSTGELEGDVFEGLSALVDHNIVRPDERSADEPRFTMLETIREYGLERLHESGEAAEARERHARYFMELGVQAESELTGANQPLWLERLEREHDNLRSALAWSLAEPAGLEIGMRLATSIWRFWSWHGHLREGRHWLQQFLDLCDQPGIDVPKLLQARALNGTGVLDVITGNLERARTLHEACLALARDLDDEEHIGKSLGNLGLVAHKLGRFDEAARWHEEVLALAGRRGDRWTQSLALHNLGVALFSLGDWQAAERRSQESLTLSKELGNASNVAKALMNLTQVAFLQDRYEEAERYLSDSLARSRQLGNTFDIADGLWLQGELAKRRGDFPQAAALFRESINLFHEQGALDSVSRGLECLGQVMCRAGVYSRAVQLMGAADALSERTKSPLPPPYVADHEQAMSALREAFGNQGFESRWTAARRMSLDEALKLALAEEPIEPEKVVAEEPVEQPSPDAAARYGITARELEVIGLLVQGLTNQEIADRLFITRRTATTHVSNILNKLGLDSRTAVVAWAVREGVW
jgi:predicted ATPase/DNA-binding CsgD family transcriptional regulator